MTLQLCGFCGFCGVYAGELVVNPSAAQSTDIFLNRWVSVFGPPASCQVDVGTKYLGRFLEVRQLLGARVDVDGASIKFKHGLAERLGAVVKPMLMRIRVAADTIVQAKEPAGPLPRVPAAEVVLGRDATVATSSVDCGNE